MAVGELLRHWRGVRRLSQLALALEAQTTTRHVSFIETGRSQPSRAMVLRLARVLDVPIRERNQLLLAAGYAPVYAETGLAAEDAALVAAALQRMLAAHEPYPAVVMDRYWNILDRNHAAHALFGWLLRERAQHGPGNLIRNFFDPDGLRPYVANWDEAAERAPPARPPRGDRRRARCRDHRAARGGPRPAGRAAARPDTPAAARSSRSSSAATAARSATSPPSPRSARRRTRCSRSCASRACTPPTSRPRARPTP